MSEWWYIVALAIIVVVVWGANFGLFAPDTMSHECESAESISGGGYYYQPVTLTVEAAENVTSGVVINSNGLRHSSDGLGEYERELAFSGVDGVNNGTLVLTTANGSVYERCTINL